MGVNDKLFRKWLLYKDPITRRSACNGLHIDYYWNTPRLPMQHRLCREGGVNTDGDWLHVQKGRL